MKFACIPAYNEESTISDMVTKSLPHVDRVVVCDDGSTDNTAQIARKVGAVVITQSNQGYGAAISSLFDYARKENAQIMVTLDGAGASRARSLRWHAISRPASPAPHPLNA